MFAEGEILTGIRKQTIVIPAAAVYRAEGTSAGSYVFVVEADKAVRRSVQIGRETDSKLEITEGLKPGDLLVAEQKVELAEGVRAKREVGFRVLKFVYTTRAGYDAEVTLVVLGIYLSRLSVDLMPNVELPVLTVQTAYPGASPETVEREVTKRIEEALNTIPGLRHMSSTTAEGLSLVVVEFELGVSITTAQQDAQAKINAIRSAFPTDMEEPVIQRLVSLPCP
jgi:hypothetical protein